MRMIKHVRADHKKRQLRLYQEKKTAFRNGSLNTTTQMHICIIYFIETNKQ